MSRLIAASRSSSTFKRRFRWLPYLLILPSFILFTAFTYYPFAKTIGLSFSLTDNRGQFARWVGFANWERILTNARFQEAVVTTFQFAAMVAGFTFFIAIIFALISTNKVRGGRVYEVMYAIPMAIASAPAAVIWIFLYNKDTGILNYLLGTNYAWILDANLALVSVAIVTVWLGIGASFIFLLVGFRNVPDDLIESATIDGAGTFTKIFKILIPLASPQIFFVVFLNIVGSFQAFAEIRLLTGGGPSGSTTTIIYSVYENAILNGRFETASVQALVLFIIIFVITRVQFMLEKRMVHYR